MAFVALCGSDGSWGQLKSEWERECAHFGEDFAGYANGAIQVLDDLAKAGTPHVLEGQRRSAVFGVINQLKGQEERSQFDAVCQVNRAPIPGYCSPVLRIRQITFAPRYDFGELPLETYSSMLVTVLFDLYNLSESSEFSSRFLNFHLASPADRQFFAALQPGLTKVMQFETVQVKGSWLYVTKAQ